MATVTGTGEDFEGRRESAMRMRFDALQKVDAIIDGDATATGNAPWHEPLFREAVTIRLRESKKWRLEAEKLAIVKEVFGGSK